MYKTAVAALLLVSATPSKAEIITLECSGANQAGETETVTVRFNEVAGWVDDNGVIPIRDGVSADSLFGFKVIVDRKTGEYRSNRPSGPDKDFRGTCTKMERKF